jgi:hypothetical protein
MRKPLKYLIPVAIAFLAGVLLVRAMMSRPLRQVR